MCREKTREVAPLMPEKSETKAEKQHRTRLGDSTLTKNVGHSLCSPRQTPARTQRETDLKAMIQGTPIRDNKSDANTNFSLARLVLYCVSHASTVPHRSLGKIQAPTISQARKLRNRQSDRYEGVTA